MARKRLAVQLTPDQCGCLTTDRTRQVYHDSVQHNQEVRLGHWAQYPLSCCAYPIILSQPGCHRIRSYQIERVPVHYSIGLGSLSSRLVWGCITVFWEGMAERLGYRSESPSLWH